MRKKQNIRNGAAIFVMVLLVAGCSDDVVDETIQLPEVNAENCQRENIMKITDKEARGRFAGLCIRRDGLVKSTPQSW